MRTPFIAANWKMNGTRSEVAALLDGFKSGISTESRQVAVFAPFVFLPAVQDALQGTGIAWGGQNAHTADSGAYTGETSLAMLKEFGCQYVLVGHSERRTLFGETDYIVADKVEAALAAGVTPVLCIGETLQEREQGITGEVCRRQLSTVLDQVGVEGFRKLVVAYEPVWAIGTGKTASPEQAQETHAELRAYLAETDADMAAQLQILYGGSMKAANAAELMAQPDIDGGLVGGASLKVDEFTGICNAAAAR
ncbi:triose-phosphate isomerase [Natronospirillum operosum]|uniref:Triosephosphate isomerase n=1 Tax=Natronospirillum operosum TaxID=2759953 RepID=A0A4Z0W7T8_9GAMM|nr:triose-phosphate isomerase [Natronospirillum operosum]TGG94124.1 triose-phosphate isomerase [Natronospirillum operosum]